MPTREEIMRFVRQCFDQWIRTRDDVWLALYRLLLDYVHGVPRITDSNRLTGDKIWRSRAERVEQALAMGIPCNAQEVPNNIDALMRELYPPRTQRMNPVGIAFACAVVYLVERFSGGTYRCKMEAKIGVDVFPNLTGFRRQSVDIAIFHHDRLFAVISSKWGIRHDRVRDPQEEADTYKREEPSLRFFVVTNEFDSARLQKVLTYPAIDGVLHVRKDLVRQVYDRTSEELANLRDLTELFALFP